MRYEPDQQFLDAAVGELVRSRNGREVNPFRSGKAPMKGAHDTAKHFSCVSRRGKFVALCVYVGQRSSGVS